MSTMSQPAGTSLAIPRRASLSTRLARLRQTALPSDFEAMYPTRVIASLEAARAAFNAQYFPRQRAPCARTRSKSCLRLRRPIMLKAEGGR